MIAYTYQHHSDIQILIFVFMVDITTTEDIEEILLSPNCRQDITRNQHPLTGQRAPPISGGT